ncbi:hypothetical protein MCUN1_001379 [Malassezia cuniculi]|uniref:Uncharacterized protein n=1 Tax=Malassezia cuniculi TaxID=948313 RepID=A0AAF0EXP8_9BASI|nr:hypothetical protein MCUN1_001379 [Malassezia cuniculi]
MAQLKSQEDTSYLLAFRGLQGAQIASIAATPLYLLSAIRHRRFSIRKFAKANWVVPIFGAVTGAGVGWANATQYTPAVLSRRVEEVRLDVNRIRRDDFHLIGSFVGAIAFPAIFLRSAGLVNGILGGAGIGGAIGIGAHYYSDYAGIEIPNAELVPAAKQ